MKPKPTPPQWIAIAAHEYAQRFKIPSIRNSEKAKLTRLLTRHWLAAINRRHRNRPLASNSSRR